MINSISFEPSWREKLVDEFTQPYFQTLDEFLGSEQAAGKQIFPDHCNLFRALDLTPFDQVRVVILGQDPYHAPGQAHGLCFSVQPGIRPPPSLTNIYKELQADLGIPPASHGCLEHWARQGVLLLNSVMSVEMGKAASHKKRGWEQFTDAIIRTIAAKSDPVIFMLWGSYAQSKASFLEESKHQLVLRAPHPSPFSAYTGFFGCGHFSKANAFLEGHGTQAIDWVLPDL